jgi:DNA-nicking Smr family endonuclease
MEWKELSTLIAEAEFRLTECEKRIRRQREIVSRLELGGAGTEQARKLLSHLVDACRGQQLQLKRLQSDLRVKSNVQWQRKIEK